MSENSFIDHPARPGEQLSVRPVRSSVTAYIQVNGAVDCDSAADIERAARAALRENAFHLSGVLALDLANVTFCGTEGVDAMLRIHRAVAREGGRMVLCDPSPTALRVLTLTGAIDAFDVRHTQPV
jgi:anti-anti-sigma factor